jgi:[citrate (pro-3S)-lyase] ligase
MTGAVSLLSDHDRLEARRLIESEGLRFETDADDIVGLYDGERLVATGSRAGYVLKMLAIAPDQQGGEALGELVTLLMQRGMDAGHETFFVYTRPDHVTTFERLNFRLLVAHSMAALLEIGPGVREYLDRHRALMRPGKNGAIVVNGNPFTLGHLYLTETAARRVEHLFLFVVREDRSAFPFAVRFRLAQEATAHLLNVSVLETSRYAVSAGTFPSYFLKRLDDAAVAQMQLDVRLFGAVLAPPFSVRARFVGDEPYCATTAAYNRAMEEVLGEYGIAWTQIPRLAHGGAAISASRVRECLGRGDLDRVASWVPPATMAYLRSPDGDSVIRRLAGAGEGL